MNLRNVRIINLIIKSPKWHITRRDRGKFFKLCLHGVQKILIKLLKVWIFNYNFLRAFHHTHLEPLHCAEKGIQ